MILIAGSSILGFEIITVLVIKKLGLTEVIMMYWIGISFIKLYLRYFIVWTETGG